MKKLLAVMLLLFALLLPLGLFADECMEGDCENGTGKGFTDSGDIYHGEWQNGEPHGKGKLYLPKGKIIEGRWLKGELLEEEETK
jgi:hypothetical protein